MADVQPTAVALPPQRDRTLLLVMLAVILLAWIAVAWAWRSPRSWWR